MSFGAQCLIPYSEPANAPRLAASPVKVVEVFWEDFRPDDFSERYLKPAAMAFANSIDVAVKAPWVSSRRRPGNGLQIEAA